jgi:hypothetical protein
VRRCGAIYLLAAVGCAPRPVETPVAVEPSGTHEASSTARAAATAPVAPRAKPSEPDPKTCVDAAHLEEERWRRAYDEKLDAARASFAKCTSGKAWTGDEYLHAVLGIANDGTPTQLGSRTSLPNCRVSECLGQIFKNVKAEAWTGEDAPRLVNVHWLLRPNQPPSEGVNEHPESSIACGAQPPEARAGTLPPETIQRIVRSNYSLFRGCYEAGLARNASLRGRVTVRFVIERDGRVEKAVVSDNTLPDCAVAECIRAAYPKMTFPAPERSGIVTVVYPIMLEPG